MKSLIIYHSKYKNNTKKIAQVFADKVDSELININDMNDVKIEDYDLIGFGSGVYRENLSPKIFKLAKKMNLTDKNVFVFSTSGIGMNFYNKKLIKFLKSKGAVVKNNFACKGSFVAKEVTDSGLFNIMFAILGKLSQGHPDDKDLKNAKTFIENVVNSL
ncbi:MAG: flavodoxin domain-containing protein [Bacillota bacterium]